MFCSLCLCTRYDAVQNRHATKFITELFPDLKITTNPILCQDCSSRLDQYSNVKKILEINKMTLKHKELNEQNCANWSNGESNIAIEKHNCLLCSELVDRKLCKLESDYLSPLLGSDFDFKHSSTTLCTNCELILRNLKSFRIRCYKTLLQMQSFNNPLSLLKVENQDNLLTPTDGGLEVIKDVLSKNERNNVYPERNQNFSFNFKVYIVQKGKRVELKPTKRSGVYLYTCPICQNIVTDIHKHFHIHVGISAHILSKCGNCNFEGKSLKEIKIHICDTNSLNVNKNIYCCKICPFKSKMKGILKTHRLIHKSIKEISMYKCKQCKFQSRQKGNLQTHLLVHKPIEEIKMHKCQHCIFQARQKGNLVTHILKKHKNINQIDSD